MFQRLRLYFETYGCFRCSQNDVIYGGNGFCIRCIHSIQKRMRKIDQKLQKRLQDPPADVSEAYLRPYRSARQLLADLVPQMGVGRGHRNPFPKSPPKVCMKWLS